MTDTESQPGRVHSGVVLTCLVLGSLLVLNAIVKTWLREANSFDWLLVLIGVVLCGMSLFRRFSLSAQGIEAELQEVKAVAGTSGRQLGELRGELSDLSARISSTTSTATADLSSGEPKSEHVRIFDSAVNEYQVHQRIEAWRFRVETDRSLAEVAGHFPTQYLRKRLSEADPSSREAVAMATAICLVRPYPGEEEVQAVKLLIELLRNDSERARYRTAESCGRRIRRPEISSIVKNRICETLRRAVNEESAKPVIDACKRALQACTPSA